MAKKSLRDHLVPVVLSISCWSGQKKLTEKDLGLKTGTLPSHKVAALGVKKIFDPKRIAKFNTIRRQCRDHLSNIGIRHMHAQGWAIPKERMTDVQAFIELKAEEFARLKEELVKDYELYLAEWIQAVNADKAGFGDVVANSAPSVGDVASRIEFEFKTEEEVFSEATDTVLSEISSQASAFLDVLVSRNGEGWNRRTFRPLYAIRDKLQGLIFLDACLLPIIERLDETLDAIPESGKLGKEWLYQIIDQLNFLSNKDAMRTWAEVNKSIDLEIEDDEPEDEGEASSLQAGESTQVQTNSETLNVETEGEQVNEQSSLGCLTEEEEVLPATSCTQYQNQTPPQSEPASAGFF